jgi:hypothetical protein
VTEVGTASILDSADEARPVSTSAPMRAAIAACSFGAAAIHLAMVPSHADSWLAEGIAFAVVGWLQVAVGVLILTRPTHLILRVACIANLVFIAAWAWTRAWGAPLGPQGGEPHSAGFVDLTAIGLEAATVVLAAVALRRPNSGEHIPRSWFAPLAVVPVGVLLLATMAIASPSATNHAHDEDASADHHGDDPDEHAHDPADEADEAEDAVEGDHGSHAHETEDAVEAIDDFGLAALHNGEMSHEYGPDQPLDAETRAALVHQLALTRLIAERFPTLGDARAAGSQAAGAFGPGMGIHMTTPTSGMPEVPPADPTVPSVPGTLSDTEILRPANLLYAGSDDDAPLAGFMYYAMTSEEPEGFAGPNDHWHTHSDLCLDLNDPDGGIGVFNVEEPTREACDEAGGYWYEQTQWMVHVWTVPGYESNRGVFSDINPAITCPDGTYFRVTEAETDVYKLNHCRSNPA